MSPVRRRLAGAWLLAAVVSLAHGASTPVGAHEGAARIEATVERAGPLAVEVDATISYQIDLHPATPRTFTVQPVAPDGAELEAVAFEPTGDEGRYRATVAFPGPGDWSLRLSSTFPPGEVVLAVSVTAEGEAASPSSVPESSPPAAAPEDSVEAGGQATLVGSEGNDPPLLLTGGIVVLVVLVLGGVAAAIVLRRRRAEGD